MSQKLKVIGGTFFVLALVLGANAATPTMIDAEPSGKRVLLLDLGTGGYQAVEDTGSKTLLWIDNETIMNAGKQTVLVVDDTDIRHSAAGLILASFDGENIIHGRNGKIVMNYRHPDICPDPHANRIYTVTGPKLTKQQLVAVLYALKPELFSLTPAEEAAQKKDIAEAAAESDELAAADQLAGKWELLNGHGPVAKVNKGSITFSPKTSEAYPVAFDHKADGGPQWTGVAKYSDQNGDKLFWAAYGTPKTVGLCVYEIEGGKLSGKWYPWYINGDAKNLGTENLAGPDSLSGNFTITSANAPATGAPYTGTVTIQPLEIVGADDQEKPYSLTWTLGTLKIQGIGIRTGNRLFVAAGDGADLNIGKFTIHNGTFFGDWFKLGSKEMGSTAAMTAN